MKRVVCLIMVAMIMMGYAGEVYAGMISVNGFKYDSTDMEVTWKSQKTVNVKTSAGSTLGKLSYVVGVGKYKYASEWVLMVRMVMEPNDSKARLYKNGNSYAFGYSEYVSVDVVVPGQMGEYTPVNTPEKDKLNLNIGYDGTNSSINASYEIETEDLEITSRCSTSRRRFWIEYDYLPSKIRWWADNKYVANESVQMGMVQFSTSLEEFTFKLR